jgi:hypothetical protein
MVSWLLALIHSNSIVQLPHKSFDRNKLKLQGKNFLTKPCSSSDLKREKKQKTWQAPPLKAFFSK